MLGLVALDLADPAAARFFDRHALTTDTLAGILVLLVTVLGVDRVSRQRQVGERARVIAAQAAILSRQAQRTVQQVQAARDDPAQRDDAADELRTYMSMLLVSAPVLIDAAPARAFLESSQRLGGMLARAVANVDDGQDPTDRLEAGAQAVRDSAAPLLAVLRADQRRAVEGEPASGGD